MLWNKENKFELAQYSKETEMEAAIQETKGELFGKNRIYLDIKKRIGEKGKKENIPDGYLIDLTSHKNPRLFVVEAELAKHHPLKHIAVQILEFNLAFEASPQRVKKILRNVLESDEEACNVFNEYVKNSGHQNIDYLLDKLVYDCPFSALVIIDKIEDNLSNVLAKKFNFGVEIISLKRFQDDKNNYLYEFEPFLHEVEYYAENNDTPYISASDVDTIIVPAQEEGFNDVFLGENRWHEIRINTSMIPRIKYIAAYETAPNSYIRYYAEVASIEPWKDSGKYVVNFKGSPEEITPIKLVKNGKVKAPQSSRYTTFDKLIKAKNLDEVF